MTHADPRSHAAVLAACWRHWADALEALEPGSWDRPTRCGSWTVHALAVHTAPDVEALQALPGMAVGGPAAFDDAAAVLSAFNRPEGPAQTMAPQLASMAVERARSLPPADVITRFRRGAEIAAGAGLDPALVVPYPVAGTLTVGAVIDIAVLEATVHGLDLAAATGGPPPPAEGLAVTRDLLVRMADPVRLIEAATGRTADPLFPLVR